ncbi:MAG: DUF2259 domain-containing protein [Rhizobiaceae bacterium]|nr:DUF2259 domain-containing protein [Rhizobiaceae bacterium]
MRTPLITALGLALAMLAPTFSWAGDFAKRHIHGFSVDGKLFAFEEYGVQDGSGFPYSNIYIIDTETDSWIAGSPFRAQLNDETKTVFDAREEARILAGPRMKSFEDRGTIVASYKPTQRGIDKTRIAANPRIVVPPIDETIEFRLQQKLFPETENCAGFGPIAGYRLSQIATTPNQTTRIIHEDNSVPSSRFCPLDYEFADLVTYYPAKGQPKAALLILMQRLGFEGPDGRYLAVTTTLK